MLKQIATNLKGSVPESMASNSRIELISNQLGSKIKRGASARSAVLEIIAKYEDLKPYKQEILDKMGVALEGIKTTGEALVKVGEASRKLGLLEGKAFAPIVFGGGYKGKKGLVSVHDLIRKFAEDNNIPKELLNIDKNFSDRVADPDFSRKYSEEFLPDFYNTFDSRLINAFSKIIRPTMGEGLLRFGYRPIVDYISKGVFKGQRPLIFNTEMGKGIIEGLDGIIEINSKTKKPYTAKEFTKKFGIDLKFVKVNDNVKVKNLIEKTLQSETFSDISTDKGKKKIAKYIMEKLSPDATVKGYNKMVESNEGMLKYTAGKIFDYLSNAKTIEQKAEAINNVSFMLQSQTSSGGGIFRGLATHTAITLKSVLPTAKKKYHSEHEFQLANYTGNVLISALRNTGNKSKFTSEVDALTRIYKQSIIEKTLQERIDKTGNTTSVYSEKNIDTDVTAKYEFLKERQIMESTLDLKTGKTFDQLADNFIEGGAAAKALESALIQNQKASKSQGMPSKNVTLTEMVRNSVIRDKAVLLGRKKNKNPRGMSTFDFDETLVIGGKNSVTATKGKESIKITSEEFPLKGPELAKQGYKFDFSDFVNVKGGKEGPLMQKLRNQIEKYGTDNVFVLTARMQEAAPAIHAWLKSKGVELKLENITGLGNSTGEAKAMWMLEKFSEGYNDMYFVDDALPNVKAVKNVLDQLDIKSNVQQALASKNLDLEINKIVEQALDIKAEKVFSKAEGKTRGKDIKRRRLFMPDTASDLELLLEPLFGKGKQGIENKKWFTENFTSVWERNINDFNTARQAITSDYMALRKLNKDVVKALPKAVEGTNFTADQAIRVYLWNKSGFTIPDLTPTSQAKLVKFVVDNPKIRSYAESVARLTRLESGLKEPSAEWWAETLATEIQDLGKGVGRTKYIQEFIDTKNEIFSEKNLNKMESKLGTRWRETIEDMFERMETGRTRSMNLGKQGNALMNYFNGSVGTIMNFNTRSAALQLISTVNFVNHSFNNPVEAAKALANTKQYAKDFMFIMNSDMLKQRRAGLEINVTEAELAAAAAQTKNPARAMLAKILKAGYIPTKIADSFAISAGGATYYRNAIKMYEKKGLSTKEAERRAFIDFQAIAERTQQSSRADLLSKEQTSFAGKLILPFANTAMQMNRIMTKEALDISKKGTKGLLEKTR